MQATTKFLRSIRGPSETYVLESSDGTQFELDVGPSSKVDGLNPAFFDCVGTAKEIRVEYDVVDAKRIVRRLISWKN